jgi:hypothetical protein
MLRKKREPVKYFLRIFIKAAFLRSEKPAFDRLHEREVGANAQISYGLSEICSLKPDASLLQSAQRCERF